MKSKNDSVTELRAGIVHLPKREPTVLGRWVLKGAYNVVVQLRSASGSSGIGYAFVFRQADAETILSAVSGFREIVLNRDPMDNITLQSDLRATANFLGEGGAAMSAIGAIDLALWDLKGKLLETPVNRLLGSTKNRIEAYASGGSFGKDLPVLEREIRGRLEQGFKAVKMKLPPDVKEACKRIKASRAWVGDNVRCLYDSNQQQTYKDGLEIALCCVDNGAYWYEEPFPFHQMKLYSELRHRISCRLALGETLYGETPFYDAVLAGAADVLMPNLHKIGGVTAWVRLAGLSALSGIPLSSHTMPYVSAHVISATPRAEMLEYMDSWDGLYENPFPVEDGQLVIPDEPGFGLVPSRAVRDALG